MACNWLAEISMKCISHFCIHVSIHIYIIYIYIYIIYIYIYISTHVCSSYGKPNDNPKVPRSEKICWPRGPMMPKKTCKTLTPIIRWLIVVNSNNKTRISVYLDLICWLIPTCFRFLGQKKHGNCFWIPNLSTLDEPQGCLRVLVPSTTVANYPLVNKHSYWKWPFIVDLPIKNGDFP